MTQADSVLSTHPNSHGDRVEKGVKPAEHDGTVALVPDIVMKIRYRTA
jgi:hypothetical protein